MPELIGMPDVPPYDTDANVPTPAAAYHYYVFAREDGLYKKSPSGIVTRLVPRFNIANPTKPVLADFTWINQGSATATDYGEGIKMYDPASATESYRILKKASPSIPYNIDICFHPGTMDRVDYHGFGGIWRQASDGKLIIAGVFSVTNQLALYVNKASDPDVPDVSSSYTNLGIYAFNPIWIRLSEDNTNRTVYYGHDGHTWQQVHQIGRTDYLTATEVGVFVASRNATWPIRTNWVGWAQS